MNFGHPRVLWFSLILLPLLALFFWATWRKRQDLIRQFVQNKTLAQLTLGVSTARQKWRRVFLFVAVSLLLVSMAGPQWGFTWEEATQRGRDIIVAIDTSRSMLATDIQPDRLTRAKLAALDLLQLGKFDRFGLIAFSGSAFLQCPLTFDDEAFRQSVQILQPGIIPQGGTALSQALQSAREAFGSDAEENHKILLLFTDGEDHEQQVMDTVDRAVSDGIRIFTIGVGTPGGELLRVRDEQGNLVYVKDESGNVVKSRLNEQLLQEIATRGKGFYLPLQGGNAMEVLYQKGLAPLPTSERSTKLMKRLKEQFYWPLAAGILFLIFEIFFPDQKRSTRRANALQKSAGANSTAATTAALLLVLLLPASQGSAARAERHYKAGEYKTSLSEYQELIAKKPADARLRYNAGAAAFQATKFDEAVKQFQASAASPDLDLQQQSFYNLGNAEYRLGEGNSNSQEKTAIWEQSLQHYEAALKLNAQDKDAEFNRDLVKKRLEELKQQQKDDKKDDKNDNKDEQKDPPKDKSDQEKKQEQKDNKSNDQQQDQKNNESGKAQDEKKKEQEKQQQEQDKQQGSQQKEPDKDKQNQAQSKPGGEKKEEQGKPEGDDSAAQYAQLGKMSPAQAKQLLDAQKGEEKALLFIPQDRKSASQSRSFKDW